MSENNSFLKYLPSSPKINHTEAVNPSPPKKSFISLENIVPTMEKTKPTQSVPKKIESRIPSKIDESYDILSIHQIILDLLEKNYGDIDKLESRLKKLEWIRDNTEDDIEKIDAKKEIFRIKKKIENTRNKKEIEAYKVKTKDLIESYKSIKSSVKSFVYVDENPCEADQEKKNIYNRYLIIARNYIQIDACKQKSKKLVCQECRGSDFDTIDDNFYACRNCKICIQLMDDSHSYKDIDRLNLSSRYTYTKKGHFKEAIDKFQGLQNTNIDQKVYDTIRKEQKKYNISNLTKEHIRLFLSENGYSKHYEDSTLIYSTLTGTKSPDISMYETELLSKFEQAEAVYEKVKDPDRTNSLNVYYKLMKLLQIVGYVCKIEDFDIMKRDKITEHDETWEKICQYLGWPFIPTL